MLVEISCGNCRSLNLKQVPDPYVKGTTPSSALYLRCEDCGQLHDPFQHPPTTSRGEGLRILANHFDPIEGDK